MTAAQRAVLLGPDKKTAKPGIRKIGMDRLRAMTRANLATLAPGADEADVD